MKHRICRCAVTAAVTANRQVYRAGVSKSVSKETGGGAAGGVVTKGVTTETDVCRLLVDSAVDSTFGASENFSSWTVRSAQVRKLVRTESDGAGHAGAGAAMRHKVFI